MEFKFEWDRKKAEINFNKHGISFDEASTVFSDPLAVIFDDPAHSFGEQREIIIGYSDQNKLILVCFTEKNNHIIRIFSSRLTTKKERKDYEQNKSY